MAVRQHTQKVCGCPSVHISALCSLDSARWPFPWTVRVVLAHVDCLFSTHRTSVGVRQHTQDVLGCPWVSFRTHRTSVAVRQHTPNVRGLSISTHISTLALFVDCPSVHISARWPFPWTVRVILAHVGCLFSTHRMFVGVRQHTQDVRGCPSAHTGRLWVSVSTHRTFVAVRVCRSAHTGRLWLSISTHKTSVAVHRYTYQHAGPWTQHAGPWTQHAGPWTQHADPWTQHAGPSRGQVG